MFWRKTEPKHYELIDGNGKSTRIVVKPVTVFEARGLRRPAQAGYGTWWRGAIIGKYFLLSQAKDAGLAHFRKRAGE